jgi:hypothetical protein
MGQRSIIVDDVIFIDVRTKEDDYTKSEPNLLQNTTIIKISTHRLGSLPLLMSARPAEREETNLQWSRKWRRRLKD